MKKSLAAILAALLVASMAAVPFAADATAPGSKSDIVIDNEVDNPQYLFQVPKKTSFAVDAFQKTETNGQIYSPTYSFINKSDVAIKATVKPFVKKKTSSPPADFAVKTSPTEIDPAKHELYMEVVPATEATLTTEDGAGFELARPTVANDAAVTLTAGDTGDATKPTTVTFTMATTATDPNENGGAKFDLVVLDDTGAVEIARVTSAATGATGAVAAVDMAALFNNTIVTVPQDPSDASKGTVNFKLTNSTTTVTLTSVNADGAELNDDYTAALPNGSSGYKLKVEPSIGVVATAALDTEANPVSYAEYDDASGAATTGKAVVVLGNTNTNAISFALNKASYVKTYTDDATADLLSAIDPNACVGAFRLMGSVAPGVNWAAEDFKVVLAYDVLGLPSKDYEGRRVAQSGEQNLVSTAVEPKFAASNPYNNQYNLAGSTAYTIKFANGTKESEIVAGSDSYTVGVLNETSPTDPIDITAAVSLSLATGTPPVPTLTFNKDAVIESGAMVNGKCKFVITFTGTDGYATTLTTADITVSGVQA